MAASLRSLDFDAYSNLFGSKVGPLTVAADTALPAQAVVVNLGETVLPSCVAALLREPERLRCSADELSSGIPRACWRATDWPQLLGPRQ